MRVEFTPRQVELIKRCIRIASEDDSIYPTGDDAGTRRVEKMLAAILEKLTSKRNRRQPRTGSA